MSDRPSSSAIITTNAPPGDFLQAWTHLAQVTSIAHPSVPAAVIKSFLKNRTTSSLRPALSYAVRDGRPMACLAGIKEPLRWGLGGMQVRSMGDEDMYAAPLLYASEGDDDVATLLRAILAHGSDVLRVHLPRQRDEAFWRELAARNADLLIKTELAGSGSLLSLSGNMESFWAGLPSNFRKNLRKQRRRLETSGVVEFTWLAGKECDEHRIAEFFALEASGWKGSIGGAILSRPDVIQFYSDALAGLAEEQALEIHRLTVDGKLLAAQVAIPVGDTLCLLKIAYSETMAELSPGNMLLLALVEREVALGRFSAIDCLTDMQWHRNWAMTGRPYFDVFVYPRTSRAMLSAYLPRRLAAWVREHARVGRG